MEDIYCYSFVEDMPSAEVAKKLVLQRNAESSNSVIFRSGFPAVTKGYGKIKSMAPALLNMARAGSCTFTLVDLDQANCAPDLIKGWFFSGKSIRPFPREVVFRIAVREVESWIMADRNPLAKFLGIPIANFPKYPDELSDPKHVLLNVVRQKGRKKWHREMLPLSPSAQIGPRYNEKICEFVTKYWSPDRASASSPSLSRAIESLRKW